MHEISSNTNKSKILFITGIPPHVKSLLHTRTRLTLRKKPNSPNARQVPNAFSVPPPRE